MFRLTAEEWENHKGNWTSSQIVMTSQTSRGKANLPYAFT